MIKESNNAEVLQFQIRLPFRILELSSNVCFAIEFNNEPNCQTKKIDDIVVDRLLAAELELIKPTVAEVLPKNLFSGCHFSSEFASYRS